MTARTRRMLATVTVAAAVAVAFAVAGAGQAIAAAPQPVGTVTSQQASTVLSQQASAVTSQSASDVVSQRASTVLSQRASAVTSQQASAVMSQSTDTASEADQGDRITWGVVPADANGPDGRRVVNLALEAGDTLTEHIAVTNHSAGEVTFRITANDGILTPNGSFDMRPSSAEPVDGGSWITVQPDITIAAGETAVVPVDITVPATATPGDHPAGVAASVISGTTVALESRVGVRFNLAVDGEFSTDIVGDIVDVTYAGTFSPFEAGTASVTYRVTNDGNVAMKVAGAAQASGMFGLGRSGEVSSEQRELLPGESIEQTITVPGVWPLFVADLTVLVTPVVRDALDIAEPQALVLVGTSFAVPWPQLALLAILALAIVAAIAIRRARAKRLENLLDRARAEGAAAALQSAQS